MSHSAHSSVSAPANAFRVVPGWAWRVQGGRNAALRVMGFDNYFDGITFAVAHCAQGGGYVLKPEPVGDHLGSVQGAAGGQGDRALDVVAALAPGRRDADVVADDRAEVEGHRAGVEGQDRDLAAALGGADALLRRVDVTGALDGQVGALAPGEVEDGGHRIGLARVDHVVGAEPAP